MNARWAGRAARAALVLVLAGGAAGCGQKGPPLAPLRPVPAALSDLVAERGHDRITLRFTVPAANRDGSTPVAIDRVEIYALSTPEAPPEVALLQLRDGKNLLTTIVVRPPDATAAEGAPPDTRPAPGSTASYVEMLKSDATAPPAVRHYAAVGFNGRRRGAESAMVSVSLTRTPAAPGPLTFEPDDKMLKITWSAPAAGLAFRVYEVIAGTPPSAKLLTDAPIKTPEFTTPVEFGRERCFVVRTLEVSGRVSLEGGLGAAQCVTVADTFPPAAPTKLVASPGDGGVDLLWSESSAPDVAGYRVLRGEGPNAILQQLSRDLVTEPKYRDTTARPGVTYVYSVIALDKAGNPSEQSNRQEVTARH